MNEENQIEEKNCKECLHFEACCKWTDFPKQIGFPICRKFTPTNTNLHQPCKSVQVEEIVKLLCADYGEGCKDCPWENLPCSAKEQAKKLYNAGYRKQSEVIANNAITAGMSVALVKAKADVAREIIGIIDKRREVNQYHLQGNNTDLFHGIYCGRDEAYRDIAEIIEKKYGAKMKGGAE